MYLSVLRLLLIGTLADLGVLALVLVAHAGTGSEVLVRPVEALTVALGLLAVSTLLLGIGYAWSSYPRHRRPIIFLVIITAGTLLAHAYIIGLPAASSPGTITGTAGAAFNDGQISVQSTYHNQSLGVVVSASGGNAVGGLQLSVTGGNLVSGGFNPQPTLSSPLAPRSATTGLWQVSGNISQITLSYQTLSCYDSGANHYGCIMDESFYVPEGMGLLAGQSCSTSIADGAHCHMEHPYLSPALVAAGMAVFGEFSSASWRVLPVLLGSFSIPIVFGICWKLATDKRLAYFAALFLALDVMFFSQSSAALLDIPETFFGLLALFAYVWELRFWKFDRYVITGVLLGIAGLAKETAIFIALGVLTYIFFFESGKVRSRLKSVGKVLLVIILVFSIGLQTYDSALASPNAFQQGIARSCPGQNALSSYPNFIDHIRYMLCYGSSLTAAQLACSPTTGYWCKFPNIPGGPPILPTDWLIYYTPVAYYSTSVSVCPNSVNGVCQGGQYSYVQLAYYGVTNAVSTWTFFVWVPLLAYVLYRKYRKPAQSLEAFGFSQERGLGPEKEPEVKFAGLALIWLGWNYIPYLFLLLDGRVTYPFYVVPAIPALAMGTAYLVTAKPFPIWLVGFYMAAVALFLASAVVYPVLAYAAIYFAIIATAYVALSRLAPRYLGVVFVAAAFAFFFVYFPDKSFLPDWLRVMIGH